MRGLRRPVLAAWMALAAWLAGPGIHAALAVSAPSAYQEVCGAAASGEGEAPVQAVQEHCPACTGVFAPVVPAGDSLPVFTGAVDALSTGTAFQALHPSLLGRGHAPRAPPAA